ncbi:MAG: alanine--tRNA ligase-related protein, partial [Candidatus Paceibacterota bacterium]
MKSNDIRNTFLSFFKERGHSIIPSAPLVPENDSSVLFITAGMQPLVPYLLGQPHPEGKRLVGVQKCVRTQDIDEVGDATHDTFFEMLGNWSLGDYFKEDAIKWSHELLIHTFGLDPARLYITVFEGNDDAPKDSESIEIWKSLGIPENRIYEMSAETNWWSPGENGPCGPDSEMFYDITQDGLGDLSKEEFIQADEEQKVIEVWNDVFMEYEKKDGEVIGKLSQKNVDTGAGLERLVMVLQKKDNIFETDLFSPLMKKLVAEVENQDQYSMRIVADHIRTAAFMIIDGVSPSNSEQGYVLRRIIRRAVRHADTLGLPEDSLGNYIEPLEDIYRSVYP